LSIAARLDRLPLGRFHWKLMVVTGFAWLFNSFNVAMASFTLALVIAQWKLTPTQGGLITSAQVMGMVVGAAGIGNFSDRYGRKLALELTLLIFGLATGLGALIDNYAAFTALRFVAGIGLGGMLPALTTLVSEFSPSRRRGALVVIMDGFWAFGLIFAATVAYLMVPTIGWQAAFGVGALPTLYGIIFWWTTPESPRFLIERGKYLQAEKMLQRIEDGYSRELPAVADTDQIQPSAVANARLGELWTRTFRRRTISIWTANFCLVFTYYGVFIWLPAILVAAGYPVGEVLLFMIYMALAQVPAKVLAAFLIESVGRKPVIISFSLLYALSTFLLGQAGDASAIILWGCTLSFVNAVVWGPIMAYTAESYPTRARSTGAGAAAAFSRVGGMLGPLVTGFLLSTLKGNQSAIFAVFAGSMILSALVVWALGEETRGRSLEEIAV